MFTSFNGSDGYGILFRICDSFGYNIHSEDYFSSRINCRRLDRLVICGRVFVEIVHVNRWIYFRCSVDVLSFIFILVFQKSKGWKPFRFLKTRKNLGSPVVKKETIGKNFYSVFDTVNFKVDILSGWFVLNLKVRNIFIFFNRLLPIGQNSY